MKSVFSRSCAAVLSAALLGSLSAASSVTAMASPAKPAATVLPIDWSLTPARIASSCATSITTLKRSVDRIAHSAQVRRCASVVVPLEAASADFNDDLAAQGFLYNVSTDAAVRKASLKCSTDAGNVLSE